MKRTSYSLVEKKLFRAVILLALIQLVIIFIFVYILIDSKQINVNDTKQIEITVDDVCCFRVARENWLFVSSGTTKYLFKGRPTLEEHSVSELYESISEGDKLFLMYRETYEIIGKVNLVVDARSETEAYRTIEEYNRGKQGVLFFVSIGFSIIEIVFVGIVLVYVWVSYSTFKGVCIKIKSKRLSKNSKYN
ncbi:MAG: hypothetical protein J6Q85_00200 [Clostridia bacterium]|nr:hypothetical protein [Clostridia bacterium]